MNQTIDRWTKILLVGACCGFLTSGCLLFHHPARYGTIHQLTIEDNAKGVAADLETHPADLELVDDAGRTPLLLAANQCSTNVLGLLLKKGARIDAVASGRSTALHLAAQAGCAAAVLILLEDGGAVNPRDSQGRTPMMRAEQFHQDAIVAILRAHGGVE